MRRQEKSYRKAFPILASESVQFIEAGATIDAKTFPIGYVPAGYCIAQNVVTGKWEPYQDDGEYVDYGVTVIGSVKYAGAIYPIPESEAKTLVDEGKAAYTSFKQLDEYQQKIDSEFATFEEKASSIYSNKRLSDEGKQEDLLALLNDTQSKMKTWAFGWDHHMEEYLKEAKANVTQSVQTSKLTDGQIDEQVGLMITEAIMSGNAQTAASTVLEQLEFVEQDVARRLLSRFAELKQAIESKPGAGNSSMSVRSLHTKIKQAAQSEEEAGYSTEYKVLQALKHRRQLSGLYPLKFNRILQNPQLRLKQYQS